jgi:hypothetical protein
VSDAAVELANRLAAADQDRRQAHRDLLDDVVPGRGWRLIPAGERGEAFWQQWHEHKADMKAAGYRLRRNTNGQWLVCHVPQDDAEPEPAGPRVVEIDQGWIVVDQTGRRLSGPFGSNADAWRWLDRNSYTAVR